MNLFFMAMEIRFSTFTSEYNFAESSFTAIISTRVVTQVTHRIQNQLLAAGPLIYLNTMIEETRSFSRTIP